MNYRHGGVGWKNLYMGSAFYPEVYGKDLPTLEQDIAVMKQGGFNVCGRGVFLELHGAARRRV